MKEESEMKIWRRSIALICLILFAGKTYAVPSGEVWTPATLDIQPYGVLRVNVVNFFSMFETAKGGASAFPTISGLSLGVLPFNKIQMEVGVDLEEPSDYPVYFNAKLGTPEDALFKWCPGMSVGVFNVGTQKGQSDMDIVYAVIGKTIPKVGRIQVGPYFGNRNSSYFFIPDAGDDDLGVMVGFDRGFLSVKDRNGGEFNRMVLAADYASGKNAFGGGGVGLYYYFTRGAAVLTGPVWFNEPLINGEWKWTIQVYLNADLHFPGK
jgi:hypothetical protein